MAAIPENFLDLTKKKAFAQLATLMPDGSPHVSPVWFEYRRQAHSHQFSQGARKRPQHPPRSARGHRHSRPRQSISPSFDSGPRGGHHRKRRGRTSTSSRRNILGQDKYPYRTADEVRVTLQDRTRAYLFDGLSRDFATRSKRAFPGLMQPADSRHRRRTARPPKTSERRSRCAHRPDHHVFAQSIYPADQPLPRSLRVLHFRARAGRRQGAHHEPG